jgi:putative addiction module killer protein
VVEVRETSLFRRWVDKLSDHEAQHRIAVRIRRLRDGNPGDVKSVGAGVSELRIHYGPGYRIYFTWRGSKLILLLAGGDKKSQQRDILAARELASRELE